MSNITIVAFHTDDDLYTNEAKRMKASADRLNLPVYIEKIRSKGDWTQNTAMKIQFLLSMRQKFSGSILYVDVDAVFHESPFSYLQSLTCDIAVHYDCEKGHLMSGTLYLKDNKATRELLEKWLVYSQLNPSEWDQKALENVLEANPHYKVHNLPPVFCWVFDRSFNLHYKQDFPIFIEHLQASRTLKYQSKKNLFSWFKKNSSVSRREKRIKEIEKKLLN